MKNGTADHKEATRVCWQSLEEWAWQGMQGYTQDLLEEEVTELLGRAIANRRRAGRRCYRT